MVPLMIFFLFYDGAKAVHTRWGLDFKSGSFLRPVLCIRILSGNAGQWHLKAAQAH